MNCVMCIEIDQKKHPQKPRNHNKTKQKTLKTKNWIKES